MAMVRGAGSSTPLQQPPTKLPSFMTSGVVKVLVVDDSAVVRQVLSRDLGKDPSIRVVGTAPDPYVAREKIIELQPDVITLDVEMPRMDGITFLRKLMAARPIPVIVLSSLTATGTRTAVEALEAGAVEVLCKPNGSFSVETMTTQLAGKIKSAARARVSRIAPSAAPSAPVVAGDKSAAPVVVSRSMAETTHKLFAIGASTGGVQALTEVLTRFPADAPGTVVVQHMPPKFTASFAERLNQSCKVRVKEAVHGDQVVTGSVLIAPGGFHMVLRRSGALYHVELNQGPEVHHQRPAVDILFDSVAEYAGRNAVGAILTGMGADGAAGLLKMKNAGARTIAQDEASCVVFGMPMEAIRLGAAERVVPLGDVTHNLIALARQQSQN